MTPRSFVTIGASLWFAASVAAHGAGAKPAAGTNEYGISRSGKSDGGERGRPDPCAETGGAMTPGSSAVC